MFQKLSFLTIILFFVTFVFPYKTFAAISLVQSKAVQTNTITFTDPVIAGDLVVVLLRQGGTTPPTDNKGGNTWNLIGTAINETEAVQSAFYSVIVNGGSSFQISAGGSIDRILASEWNGFGGVPTLDKTAQAFGNSTAPRSGTTAMRTAPNELLWIGLGMSSGSAPYTPIAGFTAMNDAAIVGGAHAYQVVSEAGTDQGGWNANSAGDWGVYLATFKGLDATSPSVSVTAPTNGSTVSGSSVTVSATASDNVGVSGVQFKRDTNYNIGAEDTTSAYSTTWDTTSLSDGSHTLIAVARDAAGNYATSTAITVIVDNTAPVVSNTTASSFSNASSVTLSLSTDETATCKYGTTPNTAYASISNTFSSTNSTSHSSSVSVSPGTYTYYVRCTDSQGNTNSSDLTINFTVENSLHHPAGQFSQQSAIYTPEQAKTVRLTLMYRLLGVLQRYLSVIQSR